MVRTTWLMLAVCARSAAGGMTTVHAAAMISAQPPPISAQPIACAPGRARVLLLSSLAHVDGDAFRSELRRLLASGLPGDESRALGGAQPRVAYVPTAARAVSAAARAPRADDASAASAAASDDANDDDARRRRAARADAARERAADVARALGAELFDVHLDDIADAAERGGAAADGGCEARAAALLDHALRGAVAVMVGGGNTFFLAHTLRRAGLGAALRDAVVARGLAYIGQSAGAIVAGASTATALWKGWDAPDFGSGLAWMDAPAAFGGLALLGASRLSLFPHYEPQRWGALVAARAPELRGGGARGGGAAAGGAAALAMPDASEVAYVTPELVSLPDDCALLWDQRGAQVVMRLISARAGRSWSVFSADDGRTWHAAENAETPLPGRVTGEGPAAVRP